MKKDLFHKIKKWEVLGLLMAFMAGMILNAGITAKAMEIEHENLDVLKGTSVIIKQEEDWDLHYFVISVYYGDGDVAYADVKLTLLDGNRELKVWDFAFSDLEVYGDSFYPMAVSDLGEYTENKRYRADITTYDSNRNVIRSTSNMMQVLPTIFFDFNGADRGTHPEKISEYMGSVKDRVYLPSEAPKRDGYDFLGWNTRQDGSGVSYEAGEGVYTGNQYRMKLYAQWRKKEYQISFDANGGRLAPDPQIKKSDEDLKLTNRMAFREGYTFMGWNTEANGTGTFYEQGGVVKENRDMKLYAVWEANKYYVSYNANGGTNAPAKTTKVYGQDAYLSSGVPTKSGYAFTGWNTEADGTGISYASGAKLTEDGDLYLYAQWRKNEFKITFDGNGGRLAPDPQIKKYGQDFKLTVRMPFRDGYTFVKWNTAANGTGTSYEQGSVIKENKDMKLYAIWEANKYYVSYNANGGTNAPAKTTKIYGKDAYISSAVPERIGYTFVKWNTEADGTGTSYASGAKLTEDGDLYLYAQWKDKYATSPFAGIDKSSWMYEPAKYVYEKGLMVGKGLDKDKKIIFAPLDSIKREEVVTVIYAMEKKPQVAYKNVFTDVKSGQWYTSPVIWAYNKKVVAGYGNKFGVGDKVTREQIAVMLYGYAKLKGYATDSNSTALNNFQDRNKVSSWAKEAMLWAVSKKVMSGSGKNVNPGGYATRGECAAMIKNFCVNVIK